MNKTKLISWTSLILISILCQGLSCSWYETHNLGLGNTSFKNNIDPWSFFTEIPDSQYVLLSDNTYSVTIDVPSGLIRDEYESRYKMYNKIILPNMHGGWNLYFTNENRFGVISINSHGEFGSYRWLDITYNNWAYGLGIPQRKELWFFTNRIMHFDATTEEWTSYNYPQGWDTDVDYIYLYPAKDLESAIIVANGNTTLTYQAMWFNTTTGESKTLYGDPHCFENIIDIEPWTLYPGYYLILKKNLIIGYDINTDENKIIMQDFEGSSRNIMMDDAGRYVYTLSVDSLYILDLVDKTVDVHLITLKDGDRFSNSYYTETMLDLERHQIITYVYNKVSKKDSLVIIDLNTFNMSYLQDLPDDVSMVVFFTPHANKILTLYKTRLYVIDLDTMERVISVPLASISYKWSAIPGDPSPTLFPEWLTSMNFKKLGPLGRLDVYDGGEGDYINNIIQYPGTDFAFMQVAMDLNISEYREYNFEDNTMVPIDVPSKPYYLDPDPGNRQLISINRYEDGVIQFIKPGGKIRSWIPPDNLTPESPNLQGINRCLDYDNNIYWAVYSDPDTKNYYFYEFSTKTLELLDSFMMPASDMTYPNNIKLDPSGENFYFINYTYTSTDISDRYLVVLDIEHRMVVTKVLLQTNCNEKWPGETIKAAPGIIALPGQDKVFIWEHYGAWCIDTNTWEVLYGRVKDNPRATYNRISYSDGIFDEERGVVVIVDLSYEEWEGGREFKKILEVDLATGNVLKSDELPDDLIERVFYSGDNKWIYMLSYDRPRYFVHAINPAWENPAKIQTRTNYLEYAPGDNARFNVHITNGKTPQKASVYAWICVPGDITLFFNGMDFTPQIAGFQVILPANVDISGDILNFVVPQIMPSGMYQFNAIFLNENYDVGPMGTWNFYIKN
jgi:hypothetical protein